MKNNGGNLPDVRPVSKNKVTFLMSVDLLVTRLWDDKEFRSYIEQITNANSVTGKWELDRGFAAKRLQDEAKKSGMMEVMTAKVIKVARAIETCLRRSGLGRNQRLLSAPEAAE